MTSWRRCAAPAMLKKGYKLGLGIDENTAAVVGPNREDAWSIYQIRMDVRPVKMQQPLYTVE